MRARLVAALLGAALLAGCSVSTHEHARVADDGAVPFALLDREAPPIVPTTEPGSQSEGVALCFLSEGRLVVDQRELQAPVVPEDVVAALASPPADQMPPARTALTDPLAVRDIGVVAGIARVDLGRSISELGGEEQLLAVAQIVCTLTARPGVGQVAFTLEGTPIEVPRGDGSLVAQPVSRDDYATLLAG